MPLITFNNGKQHQYDHPVSPLYILNNFYPELSVNCVAAKTNGQIINITDLIHNDVILEYVTKNSKIGLRIIRNSCVHLLGYAIKQLWPHTKMVIGSIINTKFYYDIDLNINLTINDLKILSEYMIFLANKNYDIVRKNVTWEYAKKIFLSRNEIYKILILDEKIPHDENIQLYYHEKYIDMCHKPHVPNIKFCRFFKLCKLSKSYWKENNQNKTLQRIYGTTWSDQKSFEIYINAPKQTKNNDHRMFANQLDLYHIQENAPGMIFWHAHGWCLFQQLKKFIRKQLNIYKYQEVKSPIMIDHALWKKTGHWDYYSNHIFTTASENREYCIKPMNCPGHIQIFNQKIRSYKDLPIRMAEFGNCHRNEPSGALHGLMRIREFTQDDAHIFCTQQQIYNELNHCIKMMYDTYHIFGFKKILIKLSTRPKKRIGTDEKWDLAEKYLFTVLKKNNIEFQYQPYDGAFYGPKIEFVLLDSLNRTWQCGTVQLDFSLPNLLNAYYVNNKNNRVVPVMIHRAILGSMERFIGIMIEEYKGFFPVWLAPIQVVIINVTHKQSQYTLEIEKKLVNKSIRTKVDLRNEKINFKIRYYTMKRVPYILICGDTEMNQKTVSVRTYRGKQLGNYDIDVFLEKLEYEIHNYSFF